MRATLLGLVALSALALTGLAAPPVVAQDPAQKQAVETPAQSAEAFAELAAMTDKFEVDSSKLALERSKRDDLLAFATQMIKDHTDSYEALAAAAREDKLNVPLPPKFDGKHTEALDKLHEAPPEAFDAMYLDVQLNGHREAVGLFRQFAAIGGESAMVKFAAVMLPKIQEHLDHVEALHKASVVGMR